MCGKRGAAGGAGAEEGERSILGRGWSLGLESGWEPAGGWAFTMSLAAAVLVASREYFQLVRNRGIAAGHDSAAKETRYVWPLLLGGQAHWTIGLVATMISVSRIVAADTLVFLGGWAFGHTPLTSISPKKTLQGAFAALAFGILNFIGSLFGDLIELMIKRRAGVKNLGSLIPGHGVILDRLDSYVFTVVLSCSFVKIVVPPRGM